MLLCWTLKFELPNQGEGWIMMYWLDGFVESFANYDNFAKVSIILNVILLLIIGYFSFSLWLYVSRKCNFLTTIQSNNINDQLDVIIEKIIEMKVGNGSITKMYVCLLDIEGLVKKFGYSEDVFLDSLRNNLDEGGRFLVYLSETDNVYVKEGNYIPKTHKIGWKEVDEALVPYIRGRF